MLGRGGRYQLRTNLVPSTEVASAVVGVIGSGGAVPTIWSAGAPSGITKTLVDRRTDRDGFPTCDVRFNGTVGGGGFCQVFMVSNDDSVAMPITAGATYSYSFYYALVGGSLTNLGDCGLQADWQTGGNVLVDGVNHELIPAPSSTFTRGTLPNTVTPATSARVDLQFVTDVSGSVGLAIDFTIRLGAAQIETGASVTAFNRTP
jgi:hypothetical protein